MFVAIPTNDGKTIFPKMLGMAKFFYIYKIQNGKPQLVDKRINLFETTQQHQKTFDVYAEITDCSTIISAKIGKRGIERLKTKGVRLVFDTGNINESLIANLKKIQETNIKHR